MKVNQIEPTEGLPTCSGHWLLDSFITSSDYSWPKLSTTQARSSCIKCDSHYSYKKQTPFHDARH